MSEMSLFQLFVACIQFFFFQQLSADILMLSATIWQKPGCIHNLILQQMSVFLCVSVSDSECVLHQSSLTAEPNMLY